MRFVPQLILPLLGAAALTACASTTPEEPPAPEPAPAQTAAAKSTERVTPEVRYYLISEA